jgi:hypothetical protein
MRLFHAAHEGVCRTFEQWGFLPKANELCEVRAAVSEVALILGLR